LTKRPSSYSKEKVQKHLKIPKNNLEVSSHDCMKKLILAGAILVGGIAASQAGVRINIGVGIPLPPLPHVVITHPAPACPPAVVVAPPVCPPVVVVDPCPPVRYGYDRYGHRHGRTYYSHGRNYSHGGSYAYRRDCR
jgi:hypothetical protein